MAIRDALKQSLIKPDLSTSQGLYDTASAFGFKQQADRILANKGEHPQKIYSGGWISDMFDTLNAIQYGVVGVIKGKGFVEGVKTRQSFSDQDALGEFGIPGMLVGIVADVAVDPLTYIAPWTILKKIPALGKAATAVKTGVKATRTGQWFGRKLVYRFGQDPVYARTAERSIKNIAVGNNQLLDVVRPLTKLDPAVQRTIAAARKAGKLADLPKDVLEKAKPAFDELDRLGNEAVKVGLLDRKIYEEFKGMYLPTLYRKYEVIPTETVSKVAAFFGRKPGISKAVRSRFLKKKGIPEELKELYGEILEAGYPTAKGLLQLNTAIENVKLFNFVSKRFAKSTAQEGFEQLPVTKRLFTTASGEKIQMLTKIKNINKDLKPVIRSLKSTYKADKKTLALISNTEKTIEGLSVLRRDEFLKFFQAGKKITKIVPEFRRLGTLPDELISIGEKVKKFKTFDLFQKSDVGIEVEKLFREGVLERRGFSSMENFFKYVKHPFKVRPEKITEEIAKGNIPKLIKLQKNIERLSLKATKLRGIDKKSIDDSFRFLEDTINKMRMEAEELSVGVERVALGELSGRFVPKPIFDDIQEIMRTRTPLQKGLGKIVGGFKFGKVIMNPATHARNIMSNFMLNSWEGLSPYRLDIYSEAAKQMVKKGKWYKEAVSQGYSLNTFAAQEINSLLLGQEGLAGAGRLKKYWGGFVKSLGNIYQGEENFAKLAQFIFQRKKGVKIEEAWQIAERATFNYAQITPFIRRLRESILGFPFITFTYKVTPQAAKTLLKKPTKISIIGKVKKAIESQSDLEELTRERASEPPWVKDGFYIKLPMKDKQGRSAYFDMTYIMPFGDLISGQFTERQLKRESKLPESYPEALLRKTPFFNFLKEIGQNEDFYGNKIWKESDAPEAQMGDLMRHLMKTYLPPLVADEIPGGWRKDGTRKPGTISRLRKEEGKTLTQEIFRNMGLKVQPLDLDMQETYMEYEKKRGLETLLEEQGVLKEFNRFYVPK